ncbi:MAG: hypothetical protein KKG02_01635 [Candidatus Edwardsbacteria bacterium]|nr:hypothetical protein [Candidatus Edwardsbacteria bacterium]
MNRSIKILILFLAVIPEYIYGGDVLPVEVRNYFNLDKQYNYQYIFNSIWADNLLDGFIIMGDTIDNRAVTKVVFINLNNKATLFNNKNKEDVFVENVDYLVFDKESIIKLDSSLCAIDSVTKSGCYNTWGLIDNKLIIQTYPYGEGRVGFEFKLSKKEKEFVINAFTSQFNAFRKSVNLTKQWMNLFSFPYDSNNVNNIKIRIDSPEPLKFEGTYVATGTDQGNQIKKVEGTTPYIIYLNCKTLSITLKKKERKGMLYMQIIRDNKFVVENFTSDSNPITIDWSDRIVRKR